MLPYLAKSSPLSVQIRIVLYKYIQNAMQLTNRLLLLASILFWEIFCEANPIFFAGMGLIWKKVFVLHKIFWPRVFHGINFSKILRTATFQSFFCFWISSENLKIFVKHLKIAVSVIENEMSPDL